MKTKPNKEIHTTADENALLFFFLTFSVLYWFEREDLQDVSVPHAKKINQFIKYFKIKKNI